MDDLRVLHTLTVPTLANAVETFDVRPANSGYTTRPLTCHFPSLGMMVGYAVTVTATTDRTPGAAPVPIDQPAYWRWLTERPGPKVVVVQDLDDPPGGAMWGEWNANLHLAVGCVGTVTEGAVRDLDALDRLGFHTMATSVSVGHGSGAFVDYGSPLEVAGLAVSTGDLLVGDQHGVLHLPHDIPLSEIIERARRIDELESEVFAYCQSGQFTPDGMHALERSVMERWPGHPDRADRARTTP